MATIAGVICTTMIRPSAPDARGVLPREASKAFACGPVVIQPERSTSATPSIVASSMLGRVKGR